MAGTKITQCRPQMATGRRYGAFTGRTPTISAVLSGTVTASISELDVVTGGTTLVLTLTNDTWVAAGATFNAQRQAILNGVTSAQAEATGWNAAVRDLEVVSSVVRTSDTVVTITWSATALYNITAQETVTATIPASALVLSLSPVVATPTFTISVYTPVIVRGGDDAPRKRRKQKRPVSPILREVETTLSRVAAGQPATITPSLALQWDDYVRSYIAQREFHADEWARFRQVQREIAAYQQQRLQEDDEDWEWFL